MKKIILGLLIVISSFFIFSYFFIFLFCGDYGYGERYLFNVYVSDAAGRKIEAANVQANIIILEGGQECTMPGDRSECMENKDGYEVEFDYHRRRAPIMDILGPKKNYPIAFLISVEKPGYQEWVQKYTREELDKIHLTAREKDVDNDKNILIYKLPGIVITPSKSAL